MARKHPPYIGVTGFMDIADAEVAVESVDRKHLPDSHHLMLGILVSQKTIGGLKNKYPNRYPLADHVKDIFPSRRRVINLIHYATEDVKTLPDQLDELVEVGGRDLDGIQLNICWPDPDKIRLKGGMRVVLQIGPEAQRQCDNDPEKIAAWLEPYRRVITDVLIDASAGRGLPLNVSAADEIITAIRARIPVLGVGVAGGLSADTLSNLTELVRKHPNLSVDAEGKLRDAGDHLSIEATVAYLKRACQLFSS